MELALVTNILYVPACFFALIRQPDDPSFYKHSNFPRIHVHLHCLGPWVLDHCHALAIVRDIMAYTIENLVLEGLISFLLA